ncbi:hypothetical protein [Paenibacillus qinlingensis]|uniref:Uncharacterized protein n=1 Tax=Paenibacillus qinlingensis TaxID=1837343 RepID=A0ABU1NVQ6_9BACL|nr:hypothetical protein [Paenibacillus qinlingensis]MDR6551559.1 hypothetical protein [Paenibacillus qinlingensis]
MLEGSTKEEVMYVSEVFEEISYQLKSEEYIICLKELDAKFPDLKLEPIVEIAERWSKY